MLREEEHQTQDSSACRLMLEGTAQIRTPGGRFGDARLFFFVRLLNCVALSMLKCARFGI